MTNYSLAVRWRAQPLRSLAFGSIGTGYVAIGTAMANPIINYRIQNYTDQPLYISYDGSTDHDIVGAGGFVLFDASSNKGKGDVLALPQGTTVYARQVSVAPGSGSVYLSTYYASNGH